MARVRVSATVDEALLVTARTLRAGVTDAVLLEALIARPRAAGIGTAYAVYDHHPLEERRSDG